MFLFEIFLLSELVQPHPFNNAHPTSHDPKHSRERITWQLRLWRFTLTQLRYNCVIDNNVYTYIRKHYTIMSMPTKPSSVNGNIPIPYISSIWQSTSTGRTYHTQGITRNPQKYFCTSPRGLHRDSKHP